LFLWPYIRGWHWIGLLDHLIKDQVRFWYQCPSSIVCCPSPLTVYQILPYVIDTGLVVVFNTSQVPHDKPINKSAHFDIICSMLIA
jgi:hypothetical protein